MKLGERSTSRSRPNATILAFGNTPSTPSAVSCTLAPSTLLLQRVCGPPPRCASALWGHRRKQRAVSRCGYPALGEHPNRRSAPWCVGYTHPASRKGSGGLEHVHMMLRSALQEERGLPAGVTPAVSLDPRKTRPHEQAARSSHSHSHGRYRPAPTRRRARPRKRSVCSPHRQIARGPAPRGKRTDTALGDAREPGRD